MATAELVPYFLSYHKEKAIAIVVYTVASRTAPRFTGQTRNSSGHTAAAANKYVAKIVRVDIGILVENLRVLCHAGIV